MKKINRILFSFIFILSLTSIALSDVTSSITSLVGKNAEGYLAPVGTMMGTGMNSGFYRKASPHKLLGFDITMDFVYSMAPPGKTTYNFYIPDDSIAFPFQFQFPKDMFSSLVPNTSLIPTADSGNEALYEDQTIIFGLAVKDLLNAGDGDLRAQNILGNDSSTVLIVSLDKAIPTIFDQVVDNTWDIAKDIDGIGKGAALFPGGPEIKLYEDKADFSSAFGDSIRTLIASGLGGMEMPELPIPGGFGEEFKALPIDIGMPLPILQASVGLPFHTEITIRGLPGAVPIGLGTVKYGGIGGKIGISDYLSDYLYPKKDIPTYSDTNIVNILQADPSQIDPINVDKAISDLKLQGIDIQEIDSLNYLLTQGYTNVAIEIKNRTRDALIELKNKPKSKKQKNKTFPIDLSLGYYSNDLKLDFSGAAINSTNRMISLQFGKTFNMPFIPWLGGIGLYGGIGFESSDLNLGYELANPLNYGCFINATNDNYDSEITDEASCISEYGVAGWHSGVPQHIALNFPGDNKFRKLIGARMRILLVDAFVDYNMGSTSNAINAGLGITIR